MKEHQLHVRRLIAMSAGLSCLVAAAIALLIAMWPAAGTGPDGFFTVAKGDNASSVAAALEEEGLIRSALAFRILVKVLGNGSSLKAGTYRIVPGMGPGRILDLFVSGNKAMVRLSIPEGFTLTEIAASLDRLGAVGKEKFLSAARSPALLAELGIAAPSAEGYLFPDTYLIPVECTADDLLRLLVRSFRDRIAAIPEAAGLSAQDLQDKITLASIVEREYRLPEEAAVIASVFLNRLEASMPLQSCATVVYIITERLGNPHPEALHERDLMIDDPYNTYQIRGLPPGPISNPGMTSLQAVFRPSATRYLYFRLVDADAGTHHFSPTLGEHLEAQSLPIKKR